MNFKILYASFFLLLLFFACTSIRQGNRIIEKKVSDKHPNILFVVLDDWSWPHASAYGCKAVKTPAFDRIAREGMLFTNAFCVSPSCTPSRGAILTGQVIHRLEEGGNLWGLLPKKFPVYPDLLEAEGYETGYTGKGWAPGILARSDRTQNPAGPEYNELKLVTANQSLSNNDYAGNFELFLKKKPAGKPFCFWYGSYEPHRGYKKGSGLEQGKKLSDVKLPAFLPDMPEVRSDMLDYYTEVEWADMHLARMIRLLETVGELDNTMIVVTGDNGMPFPRAKANLYDAGTRLPLAIRWPVKVKATQVQAGFISFDDFAPTFLEAAGLKPLPQMTGKSFLPLLEGKTYRQRDCVFLETERHTNLREGGTGYPRRAIRTKDYLYIHNIKPDRWPAGDPEQFADVDDSPTKALILSNRDQPFMKGYFRLAFEKRPAEELYDLKMDPAQIHNVAADLKYAAEKKKLREKLDGWMKQTADPRANGEGGWDNYPYHTGEEKRRELLMKD